MTSPLPSAGFAIRELRRDELTAAAEVVGRGMRDNPLHRAAYGPQPDRRLRCHRRLVRALFEVSSARHVWGVLERGVPVAVAATAPVGHCQPTLQERLRLVPRVAGLGPVSAARVLAWTAEWARHDLAEPHVHLGPLAVDADRQGQGLGTLLMREHCRRLDEAGAVGYLETDKDENVVFYRRLGYEVVGTGSVIGVPNWYMRRRPGSSEQG